MPNHNIPGLEKKISALSDALANLNSSNDLRELIKLIRLKGWTTPAEFTLVSAIVDSMTAQVRTIAQLKTSLMRGSKQVAIDKEVAGR